MIAGEASASATRHTRKPPNTRHTRHARHGLLIPVNDGIRYQRIGGIGAAMTDASAWLIEDQLPPRVRAQVMDALFAEDYPAFAPYLVRFIQSYASQGIHIAALTPENEPSNGDQGIPFPGMTLTVPAESDFVAHDLAPALRSVGLATQISATSDRRPTCSRFIRPGQVSKFVQPGASRIDSPNFVTYTLTPVDFATSSPGLDNVAFLNPDGSKVLVAYNNDPRAVSVAVQTRGRYFGYRLPGWAMATLVWDRPAPHNE